MLIFFPLFFLLLITCTLFTSDPLARWVRTVPRGRVLLGALCSFFKMSHKLFSSAYTPRQISFPKSMPAPPPMQRINSISFSRAYLMAFIPSLMSGFSENFVNSKFFFHSTLLLFLVKRLYL